MTIANYHKRWDKMSILFISLKNLEARISPVPLLPIRVFKI